MEGGACRFSKGFRLSLLSPHPSEPSSPPRHFFRPWTNFHQRLPPAAFLSDGQCSLSDRCSKRQSHRKSCDGFTVAENPCEMCTGCIHPATRPALSASVHLTRQSPRRVASRRVSSREKYANFLAMMRLDLVRSVFSRESLFVCRK